MEKKIYVHIADDHEILIEGIIAVLNTDNRFKINGFSLTGKETIKWAKALPKTNKINVLLLDVNMPELDGFGVLKYLKEHKIDLKVLVLSSHDDVEIIRRLIDIGAKGYITKNNAGDYIIEGIKTIADDNIYFSNDIKDKVLMYNPKAQKRIIGYRPPSISLDNLTDRELIVLRLIAKEYSTPEMAAKLNVSNNTVLSYRKKLLKKLQVKNSVGLAMYALKHKII